MTENLPATLSDIQKIEIVTQIASEVPAEECRDLIVFIDRLLLIKEDNISKKQKIKMTISETLNFKIIWPTLKILTRELKRRLWDKSSTGLKFGLTGSLVGLVFFGGQGAGIAALGGAIGVPLWVVFGAGAAYANHLRECLLEKLNDEGFSIIDL